MIDISIEELKKEMSGNGIVLIDVREDYEHEEFNIGGECLPLGDIRSWDRKVLDYPEKDFVLYCRSGARSTMAVAYLKSQGANNVRNLAGGMIAWKESQ